MVESRVALALGANLGYNPEATIHWAIQKLSEAGLASIKVASIILTEPVDCAPGTPDFLNTALTGTWKGSPLELLDLIQEIEIAAGRPAKHSSHEARCLDIDIILWDEKVIETPRLIIPHPRMHLRHFVLQPLAEIAPDWKVPPAMKTVKSLMKAIS